MWAGLGSKTLRTPKPHSIELLLAIVLLAVIRDPNYLRIEVVAIQTDLSRSSYRLIPVDPKVIGGIGMVFGGPSILESVILVYTPERNRTTARFDVLEGVCRSILRGLSHIGK